MTSYINSQRRPRKDTVIVLNYLFGTNSIALVDI